MRWIRLLTPAVILFGPTVPGSAGSQLPEWITVDSAQQTVTLSLEALPGGPEGIATLNGNHHGGVQIVVPLNWTVKWIWVNRDSAQSHSLVVMVEREKLPMEGGRPSLDNAVSRAVTAGLKVGQRDLTTFVADQAGWYWMLCGVPSHAIRGEWIGLKVDRDATLPAVVVRVTAP
ncbi:MAG: sulfocyanin-like copper-binding protein [Gemmatimonadota bacterium]